MSKEITKENLLSTLPLFLANDKKQLALAIATAEELERLYQSNDLLSIYTKIDSLSEELLDILAYDFKVDWWDRSYSLLEKRKTFKGCWKVRKALGTPTAVSTAVSAIYKDVHIIEWWKYNGAPYTFKMIIDTGTEFVDYDKLESVVERIKFYKNLRSTLDRLEIQTSKSTKLYAGAAILKSETRTVELDGTFNDTFLLDADGVGLRDEHNNVLVL